MRLIALLCACDIVHIYRRICRVLVLEWPHSLAIYRCEDESIDELAAFLNVGEAVAALTARCS